MLLKNIIWRLLAVIEDLVQVLSEGNYDLRKALESVQYMKSYNWEVFVRMW